MGVVKGYYNEELFGKAIGQENVSCPIECNMDEDNIEYYIDDDSYPTKISKEELKLKCKENKISYVVLNNINQTTCSLEDINNSIVDIYSKRSKMLDTSLNDNILDLNKLSLDEIAEELESFINCFYGISYKDEELTMVKKVFYKDYCGKILYNEDGTKASYGTQIFLRIPELKNFRNKDEFVLNLLLNVLFYNY